MYNRDKFRIITFMREKPPFPRHLEDARTVVPLTPDQRDESEVMAAQRDAQRLEDAKETIGRASRILIEGFGMTVRLPQLRDLEQLDRFASELDAIARDYRKDSRPKLQKNREFRTKVDELLASFSRRDEFLN